MALYDDYKTLLRNKRFREAVYLAEHAAARGGNDAAFWLNQQAIAVLRMNHPEKALVLSEQALRLAPNNGYSLLIRAEALLLSGATDAAYAGYREASGNKAIEERARKGMLDCCIKMRSYEEALTLIATTSGDPLPLYPYKIKVLANLSRVDDAINTCIEWLSASPDDRTALRLLCDLEVRRDGIASVLAKYEKMAKIPSRPAIYGELCAMLAKKQGNTDLELGHYDRIAKKSSNPSIMKKRAFALAKSGKEREAIPIFEELLRAEPNNQYVNNAYIAASRRAGYLESAWKFYHELLGQFPEEKTLFGRIRKITGELEQFKNGL